MTPDQDTQTKISDQEPRLGPLGHWRGAAQSRSEKEKERSDQREHEVKDRMSVRGVRSRASRGQTVTQGHTLKYRPAKVGARQGGGRQGGSNPTYHGPSFLYRCRPTSTKAAL